MASYTYCTSGAIVIKAGANVSSTARTSGAILDQAYDEAESFINATMHEDLTSTYSTLDATKRRIIQEAASNLGAMYLVNYDLTSFNSLREAETMLDVLQHRSDKALAILKDDSARSELKT